jgi:hypothetical protein
MSDALLLQITDLLSALEGETLANNVSELPTGKVVAVLFRETLVTPVGSEGKMRSQDAIAQAVTATMETIPNTLERLLWCLTPFWENNFSVKFL